MHFAPLHQRLIIDYQKEWVVPVQPCVHHVQLVQVLVQPDVQPNVQPVQEMLQWLLILGGVNDDPGCCLVVGSTVVLGAGVGSKNDIAILPFLSIYIQLPLTLTRANPS